METLTTNGIKVSVETTYQSGQSKSSGNQHIFSYRISIENLSKYTVQLLRRKWLIVDSSGLKRQVEGDGVIGQQPVLQPGESHQYTSWCPLFSEIGKMSGIYIMQQMNDKKEFIVRVPEFHMVAPSKLN